MTHSPFPESPYKPIVKQLVALASTLAMAIIIALGIVAAAIFTNGNC